MMRLLLQTLLLLLPTSFAAAITPGRAGRAHTQVRPYNRRNRFYCPALGRFLTPDPARPGHNLYTYPTDPVNLWDPMGLWSWKWINPFYYVGKALKYTAKGIRKGTKYIPVVGAVTNYALSPVEAVGDVVAFEPNLNAFRDAHKEAMWNLEFSGSIAKFFIEKLIGQDYGRYWLTVIFETLRGQWVRGPTGGFLPETFARGLMNVRSKVPHNSYVTGMHAWHAGSNAYLTQKLGILGVPLIFLGGIYHETPLDWKSFWAEERWQGTVNHILDSSTDLLANTFGILMGLFLPKNICIKIAIQGGYHIPGPGEPDPKFGGHRGLYRGKPSEDWGQSPGGTYP